MSSKRIPLTRLFLEVLAIFLGVTAGFLADDYRDYLNDRRREEDILRQLVEDLTLDSADIAPLIGNGSRRADVALWLVNHARDGSPAPDSVAMVLNRIRGGMFLSYEPSAFTYSALKASGDLSVIRDPQLRDTIFYYFEDRQPVLEENNQVARDAEVEWRADLAPHVEVVPTEDLYSLPELIVPDPGGLLGDRAVQNASVVMGSLYSFQASNARSMLRTNGSLKRAIQRELEEL